ncbi:MAG TPA: MltA domain-containing protein [Thermoanaerobaculia bacterium]|nr:MltA domain-containing protein [Thermoanaerobaculia bacterium]
MTAPLGSNARRRGDDMAAPREVMSRSIALARGFAVLSIVLAIAVAALWRELDRARSPPPEPPAEEPPRLVLEAAEFSDLVGWAGDPLDGFAGALARTCGVLAAKELAAERAAPAPAPARDGASHLPVEGRAAGVVSGVAGSPADWRAVCSIVSPPDGAGTPDGPALRAALERELRPWAVRDGERRQEALVTGYYEPLLRGSLRRDETHSVPLYLRPPELVDIDLGAFREELRGRRLAGVVRGDRLVPFLDRAGLDDGALAGRGLELVWVDDPVDAFFLHIQGSGRVALPDGTHLRVGFAAQNGHPYVAIGRELVARGALALEEVTMQSIRAWLAAHPDQAAEVMRANPSFVFFRKLAGDGPVGAQGVVLAPYRSIAVDPTFVPLGVPVWLDGQIPSPRAEDPDRSLRRLVVAQDTGGAIRGPLRADLFCGHGEEAAEIAGRLKHPANMWILLPRHLTPPGPPPNRFARPGA